MIGYEVFTAWAVRHRRLHASSYVKTDRYVGKPGGRMLMNTLLIPKDVRQKSRLSKSRKYRQKNSRKVDWDK
jgi:hypothetical protein